MDSARVVLHSRIVTFVAIIAEVAIVTPGILAEAWLWIGVTLAIVLSHVLIVARLRKADPAGRALRRGMVWAPVAMVAITMPLALALGTGQLSADGMLATALASAVFALPPAALGYAAVERSLPEALRESDSGRSRWWPSARAMRTLLIAWPLATASLFWLLTGVTASTGCVVDGACSLGVPFRFARFGVRGGGSRMHWGVFVQDLALLASLGPAAFLLATSRVRRVFAGYLLVVCLWLGAATIDSWSGAAGIRMWRELELLELDR